MKLFKYVLFKIFLFLSFTVSSQVNLYTGGYVATTNTGGAAITTNITSIDISSYTDISITVDYGEIGNLEATDRIRIQYSIDGGAWTNFVNVANDICAGACGGSGSGSVTLLNGTTTIDIRTIIRNDASETWWHDNLIVTGIEDPLPIELSYFKATLKNDNVLVEWETLSETNNDYFEVENSFDGIHFNTIHFIYGSINSISPINYSVVCDISEDSYYRLKQVDIDGTTTYSKLIFINHNKLAKMIIGIFDLNGIPTSINNPGVIIIIYNDGTSIKQFNK